MLKNKNKIYLFLSCIVAATTIFLSYSKSSVIAEGNSDFKVDVGEILSVSVTSPTSYASGDPGIFLRNKVTVLVSSNNTEGFVAGISATKVDSVLMTNLKNGDYTIPTLVSDVTCTSSNPSATNGRCDNFTDNHWGYSLNESETAYNGLYKGVSSTIDEIFNSGTGDSRENTKTKDIYFGTKASSAVSGTYTGTVNITVISGATTITTEPTNPATPEEPDQQDDDEATYTADVNYPTDSNKGTTVYTTTDKANGRKTETSQVTNGDNRSIYPLGETEVTIGSSGSDTATALAIAATVAATAGVIFFIAAKRDNDDDEE